MFGYILCIYLIIGVMTTVPILYIGAQDESHEKLIDGEIGDVLTMLGVGLGALFAVAIWPYWIGYLIYHTYFED